MSRGASLVVWLVLGCSGARAQSLGQARDFVLQLYQAYEGHSGRKLGLGPQYLGRQAPEVFAPSLLALILKDQVAAQGETGLLDHDPVCGCQDFEVSGITVSVRRVNEYTALAEVRFRNAGQVRAMTLDLSSVHGQWRVSNVHRPDLPSLVQLLSQAGRKPTRQGGWVVRK